MDMSQQQDDKLDAILKALKTQGESIDKMNRGLYGDAQNKQVGLMQRHYDLKGRVDKIEEHRKKAIWWGTGFITACNALGYFILKKLGL